VGDPRARRVFGGIENTARLGSSRSAIDAILPLLDWYIDVKYQHQSIDPQSKL